MKTEVINLNGTSYPMLKCLTIGDKIVDVYQHVYVVQTDEGSFYILDRGTGQPLTDIYGSFDDVVRWFKGSAELNQYA